MCVCMYVCVSVCVHVFTVSRFPQEMQANCFVMLIAGYETTSTALGFASYELATNPEVQKKLQEEVDQHFSDKVLRGQGLVSVTVRSNPAHPCCSPAILPPRYTRSISWPRLAQMSGTRFDASKVCLLGKEINKNPKLSLNEKQIDAECETSARRDRTILNWLGKTERTEVERIGFGGYLAIFSVKL